MKNLLILGVFFGVVITSSCWASSDPPLPPEGALRHVLSYHQTRLDPAEGFEGIPKDISKVYYLKVHSNTDLTALSDLLKKHHFYNLRSICFIEEEETEETEEAKQAEWSWDDIINAMFGEDVNNNRYCSLTRIDLSRTKVNDDNLATIIKHFSGYNFFVRDLKKYSSRYDVAVAPITIDIEDTSVKYTDKWHRGVISERDDYIVYYRSSDETIKAPFVMSTR